MVNILFMRPPQKHGGPGSFQTRFESYLKSKNFNIRYFSKNCVLDKSNTLIFVISSTKHIFWLIKSKIKGYPIMLRLDGPNWEYRYRKLGFIYTLKSLADNFITFFIGNFLATTIIFQSNFVKKIWNPFLPLCNNKAVIINGIDNLTSDTKSITKNNKFIVAEGELYSKVSAHILNNFNYHIDVYGKVSDEFINSIHNKFVNFKGIVSRDTILEILPNYSALLSLELQPACPNIVVESQASGTPVLAFDIGSIAELVDTKFNPLLQYASRDSKFEIPRLDQINFLASYFINNFSWNDELKKSAKKRLSFNKTGNMYIKLIKESFNEM